MFVFLLINTHFIGSFSVSVWFKQSKHALHIDTFDSSGHQKKTKKRFKTTKIQGKNKFLYRYIQRQVRQSWLYNINELNMQLLRVWRDVDDSIIYGALMRGVGVFKHVMCTANVGKFKQLL